MRRYSEAPAFFGCHSPHERTLSLFQMFGTGSVDGFCGDEFGLYVAFGGPCRLVSLHVGGERAAEPVAMAEFHRILVAIDGSEPSRAALPVGLSLAKKYGATLVLCHVVSSTGAFTKAEIDECDAGGYSLLDSAGKIAQANDVMSEVRLLHGEAVQQVLQLVGDARVDLIVVGTHGRTGVARFYIGSVAEGILRSALVPVLVVRAPDPGDAAQESAR